MDDSVFEDEGGSSDFVPEPAPVSIFTYVLRVLLLTRVCCTEAQGQGCSQEGRCKASRKEADYPQDQASSQEEKGSR